MVIGHFLPLWSELTGLVPSEWTVRSMTSRWGSCNTRTKKITLKKYGESMHLAPGGKEGYEYTAEQVYEQLFKKAKKSKK